MKKEEVIFGIIFLSLMALVCASPLIEFISPTLSNATNTTNTSIEINVSITEANLDEVKYNWNGTNFTMYNDSLVLMYNFDNLSALDENDTHVFDISGNGNNGTVGGNAVPTSFGKYNGGFEFYEDGDYVSTGYTDEVRTLSFWLNTNDLIKTRYIAGQRVNSESTDEEEGEWSMHWENVNGNDPKKLRIYGYTTGYPSNPPGGEMLTDTIFQTDQWYHVAVTSNGSKLKYYVNGALDSEHDWAVILGGEDNTQPLYVGACTQNGVTSSFNGTLDEVRVWNRVLNADEVYQQYVSNLKKIDSDSWELYVNQSKNATDALDYGTYTYQTFAKNSSGDWNSTNLTTIFVKQDIINPLISFINSTPTNNSYTTNASIELNVSITEANLDKLIYSWNGTNYTYYNDSLVLMMNFDNRSSLGENDSYVVDVSGGGNNGTASGNPVMNLTGGKYGGGFEFDGVGDAISVTPDASFNFTETDDFTVSFWAKPAILNGAWRGTVTKSRETATNFFGIWMSNLNQWYAGSAGPAIGVYFGTPSGVGKWDFITVVQDASSNELSYYQNGAPADLVQTTSETINWDSTGDLIIGGTGNNEMFNGSIDEVRIWNRTLSPAEIYQQYASNLNKFNSTQWYLYVNQSQNITTSLVNGTYTSQIFATDISLNTNQTELRTFNVGTQPNITLISPTATTYTSSTVNLQVSINETVDTWWYSLNGGANTVFTPNTTLTSLSTGAYNLTVYVNNSLNHIGERSVLFNVLIPSCGDGTCNSDETCSSCSADCGSCSSGGGSYIWELNGNENNLKFKTHLSPGNSKIVKIKSDKETDLVELEIRAKNWLTGEIEIIPYEEIPDFCSIDYDGEYIFYKALDINSTFNSSLINESRLRMDILKEWIYENNVSTIKAVKCNPYYKELTIDYINETNESGIYDIYSDGFSTFAILGTLETGESTSDDEKVWNETANRYSFWKMLLVIVGVLIIIGIITLLVKHRIYLKEKIHTKFFDFEFKFRIGKK